MFLKLRRCKLSFWLIKDPISFLTHLYFIFTFSYNTKKSKTLTIGTSQHLNRRWWPPTDRPRPLVSEWWAKLDLLSERQGVWGWRLKTSSQNDGCFRACRHGKHVLPVTHTLWCKKRAKSGMPDMSPMRQTDFAGQAEPAGCQWSLTSPDRHGMCLQIEKR